MPLDAVCLQAVVAELSPLVAGSRIEKIQQPARDQVVLLLRGSRRLLLSAGGGQPRLHPFFSFVALLLFALVPRSANPA